MKDKIENAITETLVISNKQSIYIAVDKIMKIIAENELNKEMPLNCQLISKNGDEYVIKDANGIIKTFKVTNFNNKIDGIN